MDLCFIFLPAGPLRAVKTTTTRAYSETYQTPKMERFCENSERLKAVNFLGEKTPSEMFCWVLAFFLLGAGVNGLK